MRLSHVLPLALLLSGLAAQESAKAVYDQFAAAQREILTASRQDRAAGMTKVREKAKEVLTQNEKLLAEGEGLYYRARLQQVAGEEWKTVLASYQAYVTAAPDTELAQEAKLACAQVLSNQADDKAGARKMVATVKADMLNPQSQRMLESIQKNFAAEDKRATLTGHEPPAFKAVELLNGGTTFANAADFSLAKLKGNVVVVDFWATWCPPCRAVIPELVKLQEEHGKDGLVVVGATRYYTYGMDFAADSKLPHGGKSVGRPDKLSEKDEIAVNEHFITAFGVNYPIVFTEPNVAGSEYGVTGIPTLYVIGRDGKVIGNIVGAGPENHEKVVKWVTEALAQPTASDATAPRRKG
ncbi:MAG: TlpA disulfide reductase family protein [Planctomycetota bacterium]